MDAPRPVLVRVHPAARDALVEHHQLLALFEPPNGGVRAHASMPRVVTFKKCERMRLIS